MKGKFTALMLLIIFISVFAIGCNNNQTSSETKVSDVFENFTSTAAYRSVRETLRLPSGVTVASYDGINDVFITQSTLQVTEVASITRYGLCSATEVYFTPRYKAVLDIMGDYAIVVYTAPPSGGEEQDCLGVVRFRGKYGQAQFLYNYPHAAFISQMSFLDDNYMIVLGNKDMTEFGSSGYSYATIYDYTSANGLMEVAKVPNIDNNTAFEYNDNYLAAISANSVIFYDMRDVDSDGYLIKRHSISFFTESNYTITDCDTSVYYLGNGWFIASCTHTSSEEYDGYEFTRIDDSTNEVYYVAVKSRRISLVSKKDFDSERILMVSNKYTSKSVRTLTDSVMVEDNNNAIQWLTPYALPVVPTSEIVKDGYSIAYYYYYYYNTENMRSWTTSFQIYDDSGNATVATNMVLPPVFVDGIGLQNADPNFSLAVREVGYHKYSDGSRVTLIPIEETVAYHNAFVHNGVIISYKEEVVTEEVKMTMGAVRASDGKEIIPFEYDAVSPFFGSYATASVTTKQNSDGSITEQAFFRVALDGTVTSIPECYRMCNGVYVTRNSQGKYGLNANDGTILIAAACDSVSTVDYMFKNGKTFYTVVATVENGAGVIYALGQ